MTTPKVHVAVCICTYKRPEMLLRLLRELDQLETAGRFSFNAVVVDNDSEQSARQAVDGIRPALCYPVEYTTEPEKNIAKARNRAVHAAHGDFLAFIDDDEFPPRNWLLTMLEMVEREKVTAILGPVNPHFDSPPPEWIVKGRFCDRPTHPTGHALDWTECRTGNVLLRRSCLKELDIPFREEFGTGGEDTDFFQRLQERGHRFLWCHEAAVLEVVPPNRWEKNFWIRRALLKGYTFHLHPRDRVLNYLKSFVAVPAYAVSLPFCYIGGEHHYMKFMVKLCNHLGRLLGLMGIHPVKEREM